MSSFFTFGQTQAHDDQFRPARAGRRLLAMIGVLLVVDIVVTLAVLATA